MTMPDASDGNLDDTLMPTPYAPVDVPADTKNAELPIDPTFASYEGQFLRACEDAGMSVDDRREALALWVLWSKLACEQFPDDKMFEDSVKTYTKKFGPKGYASSTVARLAWTAAMGMRVLEDHREDATALVSRLLGNKK